MKITRLGWIAYAIAIATIVLDQVSKAWILSTLGDLPGANMPLLGPFNLTLVHNQGMSFGLFRGSEFSRWMLTLFSAAVVVGLAVWVRKTSRPLMAVGVGMIIGGAVGNNLIDRIRFGYVVDFIDVTRLHFPWVFNVADSGISVGVALLLLDSFLSEENKLSHPDGKGL